MRQFFAILGHVLPFYLPDYPENQNFEKLKKKPGNIIILLKCTINNHHMMYGSWDMECNRQTFLSFWILHFLPFNLPNNLENQNFEEKKWKKACRYYHFTNVYLNDNHIMHGFWDMECDRIFCHVGPFFCPFTPLTTLKIKILKKWKNPLEKFSRYTHVYHKW